ncbi:MAG: RecX family transcriptional regulator, partial [Defluviitaleaceae bacterium]|nr:RecX family transcriptional regulator [Defluviitaleaceae bacterium]
ELRIKGVSDKDIAVAFNDNSDEDDLESAKRALEKKLRNKPFPQDFAEIQKLKAFLARRGLGFETVEKVIGEWDKDDCYD